MNTYENWKFKTLEGLALEEHLRKNWVLRVIGKFGHLRHLSTRVLEAVKTIEGSWTPEWHLVN